MWNVLYMSLGTWKPRHLSLLKLFLVEGWFAGLKLDCFDLQNDVLATRLLSCTMPVLKIYDANMFSILN